MDSILNSLDGSAFAEVIPQIDFQRDPLYVKKGYIKKGHKVIRDSCYKCGSMHTRSEHRSHGPGSFCRTHRGHSTCRR